MTRRNRIGLLTATLFAGVLWLAPPAAHAGGSGVGLGVSLGAVFPESDVSDFSDVGLGWGFWVDIPIAWKFHLTPSAELYNIGMGDQDDLDENTATDVCMNFKFIIPLPVLKIFFGAAGGVTNMGHYKANAGLLAGASFGLVANLEAFVQAKYKIVIWDEVGNLHMLHTNAGVLFVF